jgi:hypothetical protein
MSREIPQAVRAIAGLAATVVDETLRLPRTLPSLPVRVIGLAMQATMKLQQHYTGLVARGDELFTGLRGEREPGLATFDDDEDLPPASAGNGARSSAFDRAAAAVPDEEPADRSAGDEEFAQQVATLVDDELSGLPDEPSPEEVVEALQDLTDQVQAADLARSVDEAPAPRLGLTTEDALETALLEADGAPDSALVDGGTADAAGVDTELIAEAPTQEAADEAAPTQEVADEAAPTQEVADEAAPTQEAADEAPEPGPGLDTLTDAAAADVAAEMATEVDVLTPDGEVATVEATVTDEGVASVEATEDAAPAQTAGDEPADRAPVAGYDELTIAQLRGRLRGYQLSTVAELLEYEQAHGAREPYLRMLRNRLEKLERQAVEASPLAPRGA